MRYSGYYLIATAAGNLRLLRSPTTRGTEVAISLGEFELPNALFKKPVLQMRTSVDQVKPIVVTPELRIKAQGILEQQLGLKVELIVPEALPGIECPFCKGKGIRGAMSTATPEDCDYCRGTGRMTEDPCPKCGLPCDANEPCDEKTAFQEGAR